MTMIKDVENWIDWDVYDRSRMERWKYVGTDPRLDYGETYDLTVSRSDSGKSYISIHKSLHARIYKQYETMEKFREDWGKPDAG